MSKGILFTLLFFFLHQIVQGQPRYPFEDISLPDDARLDNLMSLLTLEEKIRCLSTDPSVPRLNIRGASHLEGLHGVAFGGPAKWNRKQEIITTTQFPQAYGLGETWDPEMVKLVANIEGYEARYIFQHEQYRKGGLVMRAPNADLGRDPRWGRTEECYGEDAFLTATLASAFVKGLQGNHPRYWQSASLLKHFLANSNENSRDSSSSDFDERLWWEYYSFPFRKSAEAGSMCYMAAYNRINGIPATTHPMHQDITVPKWGVKGIICTDGGAYQMLVHAHRYYQDLPHAAAACIKAGISQFLDDYEDGIRQALEQQLLSEADLNPVVRRTFYVMLKLGLLDKDVTQNPYATIGINDTLAPWKKKAHQEAARLVSQKSIVLLKNEKQTLPLKSLPRKIVVIGALADQVNLDWYSGTPPYAISILKGIQNVVGKNSEVIFHTGNPEQPAIDLARQADVVLVVDGNHPYCNTTNWKECPVASNGKEAVDRKSLELESESFILKLHQANPNTIFVLMSSFPYAINHLNEKLPAILHLTHNSQETGTALADVLFGRFNPAGRLTQTWPSSIAHLPPMMDYNIRNGRTYQYTRHKPLYPFGYGLSYSCFSYSDLQIRPGNDSLLVEFFVHNTSHLSGEEVAQLYVRHHDLDSIHANKELKGFRRVFIRAGERKLVQIGIRYEDLKYWNSKKQSFLPRKVPFDIMVGSSSNAIHLSKTNNWYDK